MNRLNDNDALELMINRVDAFRRADESDDAVFYRNPRMVEHLDELARKTVAELIGCLNIVNKPAVLDLMAAVSSHLPDNLAPSKLIGLGLNAEELNANKRLDEFVIHDLNKDLKLPFDENLFDIVINTVSVQYLTSPFDTFTEVGRILKPGGLFLVIFSNRSFPTKETKLWELLTDEERIRLVMKYFERTQMFDSSDVYISLGQPRPENDKYAAYGIPSDPVYAVFAEKKGGAEDRPKRSVPENRNMRVSKKEIEQRKHHVAENMKCPYCGQDFHKWRITENPWSSWDHDLYICINDKCPYLVKGWREMYRQGNNGLSYRLAYDKTKDAFVTIPVPNLNVIKNSID